MMLNWICNNCKTENCVSNGDSCQCGALWSVKRGTYFPYEGED